MVDTSNFSIEVETGTITEPLTVQVPVEAIVNIAKGDKGDKGDVGPQGPQGPAGPTGGQTLYSDPNYVSFSYIWIGGYGAGHSVTMDIPYGLVFQYPPRVDAMYVMSYPSEQYSNYGPNWSGFVQPATNNAGQFPTTPNISEVSRTQFVIGYPGLWAGNATIQIRIEGFIDPVATAQNQRVKNIEPPDSVKSLALASVKVKQDSVVAGQPSNVTLYQTLSDDTGVNCLFTIPPGAQGEPGPQGPKEDPQIGRVDAFYNYNCVPDTHLKLEGNTFDKNTYPDLYNVLGTNQLQDFRGLFLRGRDPSSQWDSDAPKRNQDPNPTFEQGSIMIGNYSTDIIQPNIVNMKLFGEENTLHWDFNVGDVSDLQKKTNFSYVGANGSSVASVNWGPPILNGQGGIDQRLGISRSANMNIVWAIKAK